MILFCVVMGLSSVTYLCTHFARTSGTRFSLLMACLGFMSAAVWLIGSKIFGF